MAGEGGVKLTVAEGGLILDGAVTRGGDELVVVDRECNINGGDILGGVDEVVDGGINGKVLEVKLTIPGAGEGELFIGRQDHVLDEMGIQAHSR